MRLKPFLPEFRLLGTIANGFTVMYAKYQTDLQTILVQLSEFAHILLCIFRQNGTEFIPAQLYYDIQGTIVDVYATVSKALCWCPRKRLILFQLGSDEYEVLFGILRTLTHDRNCDFLQLLERLQHCATLRAMFGKHPEWRTHSARRLGVVQRQREN